MSSKVYLFQGDSITDGNWGRNCDPNHIMGHGYPFCVAAELGAEAAEEMPKFYNRGVSGDNSSGLRQRWETDALALRPDVLTLMVGVNDMMTQFDAARTPAEKHATDFIRYEENLRDVLTRSRTQNPALLILLGLPFYYRVTGFDERFDTEGDRKERAFTAAVRQSTQVDADAKSADIAERQLIVRRIAAEFGAGLLDFPARFAEAARRAPMAYWVWDGVHPSVAAHGLMTQEWLRVYRKMTCQAAKQK